MTAPKPETAWLIDVFGLMFQVFHAIPPMTSPSGLPTNAVFGFCRDLVYILQTHRPTWLVCAMEGAGKGEREVWFPDYKANRSEMPEDLRPQIPLLREVFEAFGLPIVEHPGWEADDVIATLATRFAGRGQDVAIVTNDKDARQLLSPYVRLFNLRKNLWFDEAALLADWGIRPSQVVDFQGLVGDAVDNVPGVPLVGPKKAAALLQQFETLEGVLANADQAPGAKLRENLKTYADQARMSQKLARLHTDLPLDCTWETCGAPQPDVPRLQELFRRLGFRKLVDDVRQFEGPQGESVVSRMAAARAAGATEPFGGRPTEFAPTTGRPVIPAQPAASPKPTIPAKSRSSSRKAASGPGLFDAMDDDAFVAETADQSLLGLPGSADAALRAAEASLPEAAGLPMLQRTWTVVETPEAFARFLADFEKTTVYCLDLETTGLDPLTSAVVGWSFAWEPGHGYYLPVRGPEGSTLLDPTEVAANLKPLLEDPAREFINQNVKFDLLVLEQLDIRPTTLGLDPMVGDYLLDAGARSHNLETIGRKYLGVNSIPISELIGTGKKQKTLAEIAVSRVAEYATEDTDLVVRSVPIIRDQLNEAGLWDLYHDLERPLIPILARMEATGIKVDLEELKRQSEDLSATLATLITEIHTLAGHEFNIDSPLQLRKVLFDELKLPVKKKTKTGASTDQEVLEELALLHELPAKITHHRHLSKLRGTYVDALPALVHPRTGRIHASFNQVVAATGRLSSSDPNLQNIPIRTPEGSRIRKAFIPGEPGWKLLCADYSQIELRMLAHFSGDAALNAAFSSGADIHRIVAAQVHQVDPRDVTAEMRRIAKAVNFGIMYGQSPFGLSAALGISKDQAAKFIDDYFATYAGVTEFMEHVLDECMATGYVRTILGRRRAIEGVRPPQARNRNRNMSERTAINSVIQGSAADLIKKAMIGVYNRLQTENHPARMLLQIHDELVFETPADRAEDLTQIVREEMETAMPLNVPLVVDVALGDNWLDAE